MPLQPLPLLRRLLPMVLIGAPGPIFADTPTPASAYIMKLAAHPDDDRVLFAATHGSGLYRSDNAADHWQLISPQSDVRHYTIAVFDPADPMRFYTGGRESGLWLTKDNGESWEHVALADESILSLVIDLNDSDRLWALTPAGVFRSTAGATGEWHQIFDYARFVAENQVPWPNPDWAVQLSRFQHLTIDPHDPSTLYLGARWEGGYHVSHDGGDTWEHRWIGPIFRRGDRIIPDPVHPDVLWAETHHQGMFKSYNRGLSWISSSTGIAPQKRTPHYGAVLISGSAFDPADPATIYAGSDYSNWKTTNAGVTWQEVGPSLTCEFARSFLVTSDAVFAGTNVGIYRSADGGATWTSANRGLPTREIIATTQGEVDGERFEFAVVRGRPAVFRRSLDRGGDWVSISWLLYEDASSIRFEPDTQTVVIATSNGERRSSDAGLRWDVPPTVYVEKSAQAPAPPPMSTGVISVAIHGATVPDDTKVDPWYQRPPYVSLAIVTPDYPADGSVPLWNGFWKEELSGLIEVPPTVIDSDAPLLIRVEVRDFHYGTRVGVAPLQTDQPNLIEVGL